MLKHRSLSKKAMVHHPFCLAGLRELVSVARTLLWLPLLLLLLLSLPDATSTDEAALPPSIMCVFQSGSAAVNG
jgi:hypothetical protein